MDRAEKIYRKGVERWAAGDLDGAVRDFTEAGKKAGGLGHPWWFAIVRGHATIEMERGNFDEARHLLRHMPFDQVSIAQQIVLRARLALFSGDDETAAQEVSVGLGALALSDQGDIPSLMNGAIAQLWAADILVELGYGDEALRQVERARARMQDAGVDDKTLQTLASLSEAGGNRLLGDLRAADRSLKEVDTSLSIDLPARVTLERARLVAAIDTSDVASTLFAAAISQFQAIGHTAEAARADAERSRPPTARRDDPEPVERWALRGDDQIGD